MPDLGQNFCSYFLKTLAIVFGIIAIILSVQAGKTCDFINVEDTDGDMLDYIRDGNRPPFVFGTATRLKVGIYKYEILRGSNVRGCVDYPQKFFEIDGYPSITAAQLCSILAPIFCSLGIISTLIDFCVCTFPGSSLVGGLLFVLAMGIQCGVFGLVADPVFCFEDSELECKLGGALYMTIAAVIFYFFAACFACCTPYSDPCYQNFKMDDDEAKMTTTTTTTTTTKRATIVNNDAPMSPKPSKTGQGSFQSPNEHGGRQKARPATGNQKYDKFGNRVFY